MDIIKQITSVIPFPDKYLMGHADMTGLLTGKYSAFRYAISLARKLDDTIVNSLRGGPTRPYFDHYHQVNAELADVVKKVSAALTQAGMLNAPIPITVNDSELPDDYEKTLRMPFSHKMAATRAGLGWIGKTDLLITRKFGPRVRLATVLLEKEIHAIGKPITTSRCGKCNICVVKCPARAANGKLWDVKTDRDLFYNPFICREKCRELSLKNLNEEISLCGICVFVCPIGR